MRRKGYTVVEVLIAAALLAVLATVMGSLTVQANRIFRHGTERAEAQQNALTVISRTRREVQAASPGSAILVTSGLLVVSWIGTLPQISWSPTGDPQWQSKTAIYLDGNRTVHVQRHLIPPTPDAPVLTPADFTPDANDTAIARDVDALTFTTPDTATVKVAVTTSVNTQGCTLQSAACSLMIPATQ